MSNNKGNEKTTAPVIPAIDARQKEDNKKMGDILYIGNGAAGNKAVMRAIEKGVISVDDTLLINSTRKDFPKEYTGNTIVLSDNDGGCAKDRVRSKKYMMTAIESGVIEKAIDKHYENIVIVTSFEGGTGSGSTPVLGKYCLKVLGKIVRIYCFAGFEDDPHGLGNTVGFFKELDFECAVQCIKNSAFKASSKFAAEQAANDKFCEDIRILSGKDIIDSTQNLDNTELKNIRNTIGYCVVDKIEFDDTLMSVEDFNKICKQMIVQSKALHCEASQIRFGVILNIKPESEDAIDTKFTVLKETYGNSYDTFMHKQWDGNKQYIAIMAAGMKLPLDEAQATYDRYQEASSKVNTEKDSFIDATKKMEINEGRFQIDSGDRTPTISTDDFLASLSGTVERK